MLPSVTTHLQKFKNRVRNALNFCQIRFLSPFLRKKAEKAQFFLLLDAFKKRKLTKKTKNKNKKTKNSTDPHKYSEIPLEDKTTIFFFLLQLTFNHCFIQSLFSFTCRWSCIGSYSETIRDVSYSKCHQKLNQILEFFFFFLPALHPGYQ